MILRHTYDTESNIDLPVNGRPNDNSLANDMGNGAWEAKLASNWVTSGTGSGAFRTWYRRDRILDGKCSFNMMIQKMGVRSVVY
jgi:hypothetical protein